MNVSISVGSSIFISIEPTQIPSNYIGQYSWESPFNLFVISSVVKCRHIEIWTAFKILRWTVSFSMKFNVKCQLFLHLTLIFPIFCPFSSILAFLFIFLHLYHALFFLALSYFQEHFSDSLFIFCFCFSSVEWYFVCVCARPCVEMGYTKCGEKE